MFDGMIGYTNPINDPAISDRVLDASPNTGRVLAGTANGVTLYKKLRKKEDDMQNRPTRRVVRPVSDSQKNVSVSRKDARENDVPRQSVKKQATPEGKHDDADDFEPFVGILVDYIA